MSKNSSNLDVDVPLKKTKSLTRAKTINFDDETYTTLNLLDEKGVEVNEWIRRVIKAALPSLLQKTSDLDVA